jgi:carbon-monoxide dehydrogenase catalytic subunit
VRGKASIDPCVLKMLEVAEDQGVETAWDRYARQLPQCGFGETGLCCRNCVQGPCRIDPFGDGPAAGVCGAGPDTIVARNLIRAIAAGAATHSGHAKHLAHVLRKVAQGQVKDYQVKDEAKLVSLARRLGFEGSGKELVAAVAEAALAEFSEREEPLAWLTSTLNPERLNRFKELGVLPQGIDSAVSEILHRTTLGVDADPVNLLLGGIKGALADFAGCHMGTDLADVLFGTPSPVVTEANMGVLKEKAVNIALHGHNPVLSDLVCQAAREEAARQEALEAGAEEGVNLVGICCTGNEVLMRHGIPPLTHSVSQELPILTGALDAMVVDYQCVYPSLGQLAGCYGTRLITTMAMAKIPGAVHVELEEEKALEKAREIIRLAIEAFKARRGRPVRIPQGRSRTYAGFSVESIVAALAKLNADDPLAPLVENIANGNIQGVVLFAGCNNVKVPQDENFVTMAKELARRDVMLLATGCGAGSLARHGLLTPEATAEFAGPGLKAVLTAVGEANNLGGPLPLVLHLGSCVDNSRAVDVAVALARKLGVDTSQLPVVASAPEFKTEKAVAIGTWAVALGFPTHLGLVPPVLGSKLVTEVLTEKVKDLLGGYFIVEPDPVRAAEKVYAAIQERRAKLNLAGRPW